MAVFRFKIALQDDPEVYRTIDVKGSQHLEHLHHAIVSAFDFRDGHLASFYMSNPNWKEGQEITLLEMEEGLDDAEVPVMKRVKVARLLEETKHLLYVYDFSQMMWFQISLEEELEEEPEVRYPYLVESMGESPEQEATEFEDISEEDGELMGALRDMNRRTLLEDENEFGDENDQEDLSDGFYEEAGEGEDWY